MKSSPKATYGEAMIRQALEQGAVAKLLISEGMRKNVVEIKCKSCGNEWSPASVEWMHFHPVQIVKQMVTI